AELVYQTTLNLEADFGKLARDKVCTLIIIEVHARDIIDSFLHYQRYHLSVVTPPEHTFEILPEQKDWDKSEVH
ncbi:MAG: hypothetical protein CMH06_05190, partial [Marinovum sp.]|nr:hypothetical protein [Marinovum sp.]